MLNASPSSKGIRKKKSRTQGIYQEQYRNIVASMKPLN